MINLIEVSPSGRLGQACDMIYGHCIPDSGFQGFPVAAIALNETHPLAFEPPDISRVPHKTGHLIASADQELHEMAAHKTGAAGDQDRSVTVCFIIVRFVARSSKCSECGVFCQEL
jgi:hypothetical protein